MCGRLGVASGHPHGPVPPRSRHATYHAQTSLSQGARRAPHPVAWSHLWSRSPLQPSSSSHTPLLPTAGRSLVLLSHIPAAHRGPVYAACRLGERPEMVLDGGRDRAAVVLGQQHGSDELVFATGGSDGVARLWREHPLC